MSELSNEIESTDDAPRGCKLAQYAEHKKLPVAFLREQCGLRDTRYPDIGPAVRVPFYGESGDEISIQYRVARSGKDKQRFKKGCKAHPYGLDRLSVAREAKYIVLPEGPSCTQTCWYADVPALGLPSGRYDAKWDAYLDGIETLYVVVEADQGGATLLRHLRASRHVDRIRLVRFAKGCKDVSALFIECDGNKERFRERFDGMRASATSLREEIDAEIRAEREALIAADGGIVEDASLFDDMRAFLTSYVVLPPYAAETVALWLGHTHAVEASDTTPYLAALSPEKRSGKTRLEEAAKLLARAPLLTADISAAALYRTIEANPCTIFVDEVDTIFGKNAGDHEDFRRILNAGFRRGAVVTRCEPDGEGEMLVRHFNVYAPKMLAGIGRALPDTVLDRSIVLRMRRKTRKETVRRFRFRKVAAEAAPLRTRLERWARQNLALLIGAEPTLSDKLEDRAQDMWEPLFAIADAVGGEWPKLAKAAALALSGAPQTEDDSLGVQLLQDLRSIFDASTEKTHLSSALLIDSLRKIDEGPWGAWEARHHGKAFEPRDLARLLRPYDIRPTTNRDGKDLWKGYRRDDLLDAWARYLSDKPAEAKQSDESGDHHRDASIYPPPYGRNSRNSVTKPVPQVIAVHPLPLHHPLQTTNHPLQPATETTSEPPVVDEGEARCASCNGSDTFCNGSCNGSASAAKPYSAGVVTDVTDVTAFPGGVYRDTPYGGDKSEAADGNAASNANRRTFDF